jgi:dihydropteroate synthase
MEIGNTKINIEKEIAVVGIVNVTDDSFSGDGLGKDIKKSLLQIEKFVENGVEIIDIGAESTRPHSLYPDVVEISEKQEIDRVVALIKETRKLFDVPISIDTRKSKVAIEAIEAGANIINDISMMEYDPSIVRVVKNLNVPYVLTHNRKINSEKPVTDQVIDHLAEKLDYLESYGVKIQNIIIDPGFGFNKSIDENISLHKNLEKVCELGLPVMIGTSRKSFLGKIANDASVKDREEVSIASVLSAKEKGVKLFRVHNAVSIKKILNYIDKLK